MTEEGLVRCLRRLRQLRTLDISGVRNVTDRVLDVLAGVESLTELTLGEEDFRSKPVEFTMEALCRLIVASRSLSTVQLPLDSKRRLAALIAGLTRQLDPDHRVVTLAIYLSKLRKLPVSVLPTESSPLRLVDYTF